MFHAALAAVTLATPALRSAAIGGVIGTRDVGDTFTVDGSRLRASSDGR
jgi:hypothetical protein